MSGKRTLAVAVCAGTILWGLACTARAADEVEPPALPTQVEVPAPEDDPILSRGDNAWMLTSRALVLMMTAPGLAMFYGGLVRKKNVLSVIMQCFFLMGLMTVIWALYGYSLSFGGTHPWIGNGEYLFMQNVQAEWTEDGSNIPLYSTGIPMLTHMLFQGMFFIITPALICGAFAERMKFSAMVVFTVLWGTLVYCPLCPLGVGRRHPGLQRRKLSQLGRRGARLRRRHGRAHQLRRVGPDLRPADRQTPGPAAPSRCHRTT